MTTMQAQERVRRDSRHGERFVYAGVAFEILADRPGLELGEEHRTFVKPGPSFASVTCAVTFAPELDSGPSDGPPPITWSWEGNRGVVETGSVRAEVVEVGSGTYAATATLGALEWACSSLVSALSTAIVQRRGGLVLHSAGVVLDGRAHLFIGPSGAGKTTAAHHCPGATWIARDRSAVVPVDGVYRVWGLAGGDPIDLPQSPVTGVPLAGIYRIRRDRPNVAIEDLPPVPAALALRESTFSGGGLAEEELRWDAIERLLRSTRVAALHTRLGAPIVHAIAELR